MSSTALVKRACSMMVALILVTTPMALLASPAAAQVQVETWSTDQVLKTEWVVASDEQLVIEAGVHVQLDPDVNLTVYGNITVRGTPTQPVWFEWNQTGLAWGAINIFGAREESHFHHAMIFNAHEGIYASGSDVHVQDCNISFSIMNGTHVTNGKATVLDSGFSQNGLNPDFTDSAIYLNNATGRIEGNNIVDNNNGIFMKEGSDLDVKGNYISGATSSSGFGIALRSGSTSFVEGNTIWNNHVGIISNGSMASINNNTVELNTDDGILVTAQDNSTFLFNTIRRNGDDGMDMNPDSTPFILSNDIYNNTDHGILVYGARPTLFMNDVYGNRVGVGIDAGGNVTSSFMNELHHNEIGVSVVGTGSYLGSMVDFIHNNTDLGIYLNGSLSCFYAASLADHKTQLRAHDGAWTILGNGSMAETQDYGLDLVASNVTLLNFTRDSNLVRYDGSTSNLTVAWYLGVKVLTNKGLPFPGVNVTVTPVLGQTVENRTNINGEVNWIPLVQSYALYNSTGMIEHFMTPHTVNASYGGFWNSTTVTMDISRNITLQIDVPNEPPSLTTLIPNASFPEDTDAHALINLSTHFSDEGPLNFTLVLEEDPAHIDGIVNGTFLDFLTPAENWSGGRRFQVRAEDQEGASTLSNEFTVTVTPVNDPPTISPVEGQVTGIEEKIVFQLHATDVDNTLAELTFKSDDVLIDEVTVTLDQNTGLVTFWSMLEGIYELHFYVCDPGLLCSANITVTVAVIGDNVPPFFTSPPPRTAYINTMLRYEVQFRDPDGDPLDLQFMFGPPGMALKGTNLSWTPTYDQLGDHDVQLRLSDGLHMVYQNFTVTVLPRNHAPEAWIISPLDGEVFDHDHGNISFSGGAFDEDGDPLAYTWKIDGKVAGNDLGLSLWLGAGTHAVSFGVSDGKVTTFDNITIMVKGTVGPPEPSQAHNTTVGGDDWCMWLPAIIVVMVVVTVIVVNQFGPERRQEDQ